MVKAQTKWNKHLMSVYKKMKAKNKNVTLAEAMKEAKRSYK